MARSVAAQLLLGLDYIHSCGVVHGDLHLNNILLRQHFENMTIDQLHACLGEPVRVPVKRLGEDSPGFPKYCVPPAYITQSSEEIVDAQIIISDFGEALFQMNNTRNYALRRYFFPQKVSSVNQLARLLTCGLLRALFIRSLVKAYFLRASFQTKMYSRTASSSLVGPMGKTGGVFPRQRINEARLTLSLFGAFSTAE
ncbi:hypothetical protein SI65_02470 [Aspergillus cristatus]|uniref:Protein kinase domain-containing protein n=1 Tax=Aspergillus cristatus TaxID=573508 RepID=A0A1E3BML1_ASPCR|nr:hypothetical protein SI65_02470 [Aspergillus cristatus]